MISYILYSIAVAVLVVDALKIIDKVNIQFFFNRFWLVAGVVVSFIPGINILAMAGALFVRYSYHKNYKDTL